MSGQVALSTLLLAATFVAGLLAFMWAMSTSGRMPSKACRRVEWVVIGGLYVPLAVGGLIFATQSIASGDWKTGALWLAGLGYCLVGFLKLLKRRRAQSGGDTSIPGNPA